MGLFEYDELRPPDNTADIQRYTDAARLAERNMIALDNYRGHTFSDSTDWKAKYQKFIDTNERRIAQLKARQERKGGMR